MPRDRTSRRETAIAAGVAVAALLPFIQKAFTIDDPMFLWAARQITRDPLNPYGFDVHWYLRPLPMWMVNKNPPLASYFIALAGRILGWTEAALHLSFLVPAAAAIAGTHRLAARLSPRPLLAAMATLATPVFLVSATNVMCDVLLLACWVWALVFWIEGLDRGRAPLLFLAAFLVATASLVKYFGMTLVPLLGLYAAVRKERPALWFPPLAASLIVLAGYQEWTRRLYGHGLLLGAADYVGHAATLARGWGYKDWTRFLAGLVFTGGCVLPALVSAPFVWSRGTVVAMGAGALTIALVYPIGWSSTPLAGYAVNWPVTVWVQAGFFAAGGICVIALAAAELRARRDADAFLLALWILGTFLFAAVLNWDVTGRAILPMAPAAAILLARRLGPPAGGAPRTNWKAWGPVALSGAVAALVAFGDASFADSQRRAAGTIRRAAAERGVATLWYEGHWGFQYYMDAAGGRPLNIDGNPLMTGDWVVIPVNNTNRFDLPADIIAETRVVSLDTDALAATMLRADAAGFYASTLGPLPYSLGPASPDQFIIHRLGKPAGR